MTHLRDVLLGSTVVTFVCALGLAAGEVRAGDPSAGLQAIKLTGQPGTAKGALEGATWNVYVDATQTPAVAYLHVHRLVEGKDVETAVMSEPLTPAEQKRLSGSNALLDMVPGNVFGISGGLYIECVTARRSSAAQVDPNHFDFGDDPHSGRAPHWMYPARSAINELFVPLRDRIAQLHAAEVARTPRTKLEATEGLLDDLVKKGLLTPEEAQKAKTSLESAKAAEDRAAAAEENARKARESAEAARAQKAAQQVAAQQEAAAAQQVIDAQIDQLVRDGAVTPEKALELKKRAKEMAEKAAAPVAPAKGLGQALEGMASTISDTPAHDETRPREATPPIASDGPRAGSPPKKIAGPLGD